MQGADFVCPRSVAAGVPPARSDVPGEELRWMPEYTQFSTLDTRYDED